MSAEATASRFDGLKWLVVGVLVAVAVVGNSYFSNESLLYRVLAIVALAAVAGFVALQTAKGASFWSPGKGRAPRYARSCGRRGRRRCRPR
jgi:preprotein translocase subunit SecE